MPNETPINTNAPSTNDLLAQIVGLLQAQNPETEPAPDRAYGFKKAVLTATSAQSFNFDFTPAYFAVYIQYSAGNLGALFREGQSANIIATDSDAIPMLDGLFIKVPARDSRCTIQNLSGSSITALVFALGPGADVVFSQFK